MFFWNQKWSFFEKKIAKKKKKLQWIDYLQLNSTFFRNSRTYQILGTYWGFMEKNFFEGQKKAIFSHEFPVRLQVFRMFVQESGIKPFFFVKIALFCAFKWRKFRFANFRLSNFSKNIPETWKNQGSQKIAILGKKISNDGLEHFFSRDLGMLFGKIGEFSQGGHFQPTVFFLHFWPFFPWFRDALKNYPLFHRKIDPAYGEIPCSTFWKSSFSIKSGMLLPKKDLFSSKKTKLCAQDCSSRTYRKHGKMRKFFSPLLIK